MGTPDTPSKTELSWREWEGKLEAIGKSLEAYGKTASIEIFGSGALMRGGMLGRTSIDLDIWMPNSRIDDLTVFRHASEKVGLALDPKGELEDTMPYLQLVTNLDTMPQHESQTRQSYGTLEVTFPEMEVLAASKLAAGREKDIFDLVYLQGQGKLNAETLDRYISLIPDNFCRNNAIENKIYLDPQITEMKHSVPPSAEENLISMLNGLRKEYHIETDKSASLTRANIAATEFAKARGNKTAAPATLAFVRACQQFVAGEKSADEILKLILPESHHGSQ